MTGGQQDPPDDVSPSRQSGSSSRAVERARLVALAELQRQPHAVSWQRQAMEAVLLVMASTTLVMAVGAWFSIVEIDRLRGRLLPLLLLLVVQGLGLFAAIAPGRVVMRRIAAGLAVAAAIAIMTGRGGGAASATPAFACSTSHLAVDLIPLGFVLYSLRRFSVTLGRSLLAGVAAAATGAIAGELSCGRGWSHVAVHHIGSGIAIAIACVLLTRLSQPQSFAP